MDVDQTLVEEWPYAYVLHADESDDHCSYCLVKKEESLLQSCSKCQFARYCNKECQRKAWPDHKKECSYLHKHKPFVPSDTTRLMARVLFKLMKGEKGDKEKIWSKRNFDDLMTHTKDIKERNYSAYGLFENTLTELRKYVGLPLEDAAFAFEVFGAISTNRNSIRSIQSSAHASGLYLGFSALDHSCDPDVWSAFDGPNLLLRTTKPNLTLNTNLKISYIEPFDFTSERRTKLQENYYFTCNCDKCTDLNWDRLLLSVKCSKCQDAAFLSKDKENEAICQNNECKSNFNAYDAVRLMQEIGRRNISTNFSLENTKWAVSMLDSIETLLSDANLFAYHLRNVARAFLGWRQNENKKSIKLALQARDITL
uniref:MYND-type domain-containing protein n=1 Tax=Plectus sambesii TaxID=2011161 RepID=A0A914XG67_9BILA